MNSTNYYHVVKDSQFFDNLEQILSAVSGNNPAMDKDYIIKAIENTIKNGYILIKKEEVNKELQPKSRCCGRCDGINDICVGDQYCIDHEILGCEECFGKR